VTRVESPVLEKYRLSAYFAANEDASIKEGVSVLRYNKDSVAFFYNCVRLRDPKGVHPYLSLQDKLHPSAYARLRTRVDWDKQKQIIQGFLNGETVTAVSNRLGLHYHPVTTFSLVYQMATHVKVNTGKTKWIPYSAEQYHAFASQLREHAKEHGTFPDTMQAELIYAVREMFAEGPNDPLWMDTNEWAVTEQFVAAPDAKSTTFVVPVQEEGKLAAILTKLESIERTLSSLTSDTVDPSGLCPTVESTFALDVITPHNSTRWLSKEVLALFPKIVKASYIVTQDDTPLLFELEEAGIIEIPRVPSQGLMGGTTIYPDQLRITDRGWQLHYLIRDICEATVYCCLADIGAFLGFDIQVKEHEN